MVVNERSDAGTRWVASPTTQTEYVVAISEAGGAGARHHDGGAGGQTWIA